MMAAHTRAFEKLSADARVNPVQEMELEIDPSLGAVAKGAAIFRASCSGCHSQKEKVVGPPVLEMVKIYTGKVEDLKKWIVAPGKKRPDYPQMPGFPQLSADDLDEVTRYILSIK